MSFFSLSARAMASKEVVDFAKFTGKVRMHSFNDMDAV
jgi:hypothetical protein